MFCLCGLDVNTRAWQGVGRVCNLVQLCKFSSRKLKCCLRFLLRLCGLMYCPHSTIVQHALGCCQGCIVLVTGKGRIKLKVRELAQLKNLASNHSWPKTALLAALTRSRLVQLSALQRSVPRHGFAHNDVTRYSGTHIVIEANCVHSVEAAAVLSDSGLLGAPVAASPNMRTGGLWPLRERCDEWSDRGLIASLPRVECCHWPSISVQSAQAAALMIFFSADQKYGVFTGSDLASGCEISHVCCVLLWGSPASRMSDRGADCSEASCHQYVRE
jgi:hypothetical protein